MDLPFAELVVRWQQEHSPGASPGRCYKQVVGHLKKFHPKLRLRRFTRRVAAG